MAAIIADLKRDASSARNAFLRIWEIPPSVIPRLIDQVENTETSQLESLQILAGIDRRKQEMATDHWRPSLGI